MLDWDDLAFVVLFDAGWDLVVDELGFDMGDVFCQTEICLDDYEAALVVLIVQRFVKKQLLRF